MSNEFISTSGRNAKNRKIKIGKEFPIFAGIIIIIAILSITLNIRSIKFYENQYILKAQQLAIEYGLRAANIKFDYIGKYEGNRRYDLVVESSDFENLDIDKQFRFVSSLDGISVSNAYYIVLTDTISNGNKYDIDVIHDNVLNKNGSEYYVEGIKVKKTFENSSSNSILYSSEPSEDDKSYAWTVAIREVKERLKAPSTAKFPSSYSAQDIKEVDYKTFVVNSYVDAENSFGAKIRVDFMVKIERTEENKYKVLDVQLYE